MSSRTRSLAVVAVVLLVVSFLSASTGARALTASELDASEGMAMDAPKGLSIGESRARPAFPPPVEPPSVPQVSDGPSPVATGTASPGSLTLDHPVGPFGGAADYDSGWVDVDPGETRVLQHDLGGDPDDYVVDLWAVPMGFISQAPFSQSSFGGDRHWEDGHLVERGYVWHSLDDRQIKVVKGLHDDWMGLLRVRIWRVPDADYDSDWVNISRDQALLLEHKLAGDPDDYFVYLEFHDKDGSFGVNRAAYGYDAYHADGDHTQPVEHGAAWLDLTSQEIGVHRAFSDIYAERLRVRIWRVPGADHDSGWVDIDKSQLLTLEHNLGGPWNDFFVDVQFRQDDWYGRHQIQYGLDTTKPFTNTRVHGVSLHFLMDGTVSIFRGGYDGSVERVRVRIWANPKPKYDSGWVAIDQDEWLTLEHDLGGDPRFYHVDLQFRDTDADGECCHGINQWAYGGDIWIDADDDQQAIGAYWNQLTSDSVVVRRFPGDHKADEIRLRIWLAPPPDFGYAGNGAGAGPGGKYDHHIGGDPDDYVVSVQAQDGDRLGLNTLGFGRDQISADEMQGYHWTELTDESVEVVFGGDSDMEYPSVSIWQNPNPDYDSGWRSLATGAVKPYAHRLGFHPDVYVVDLQFQGEPGGLGVNQAGYGRDRMYHPDKGWSARGAHWYDLTSGNVSVWRESGDAFAAKGRVRIWYTGGCYAVEADVNPAGGGRVEVWPAPNCGSGRGYTEGTVVELGAVANAGYTFEHWSTVWGAEFTDNPQAFLVDGDSIITAHFDADADPFPVLFDEAHGERNTLSWTRAQELSNTLPWHPDPEWVYFGELRDALAGDFALVRNADKPLTDALLRDYRALILAAPEEGLTPAEQQAVSRYVRGGGGVVFVGDCGLGMADESFWWNTFGFSLKERCLFSPIPDLSGDFAVTDFHDQAPGGVTHYNTNWGASFEAAKGVQQLAWTDADTWEDSNDSGEYERGEDETGKFLVLAEYDGGCGRVAALSDDAFQDAGFDDYDNDGLMRALLTRVMGGAACGYDHEVYLPLVLR